jgi:predicted amidophosphoribosyltransferase
MALAGIPVIAGGRLQGALQRAIHTYKYGGRRPLAADLTGLLVTAVGAHGPSMAALSFVPLHPARLRERGFNQAQRIANELGRRLSLPVVDGLAKTRATPAQVGRSQAERQLNMDDAFTWTAPPPPPGRLALVDDVCTTGATLLAALEAVQQAGGSISAFLVLARAQSLPALAVTFPEQPACS